ncbi:MAG TPA: serine/threonine protein kinase [Gammaproteobacteria bacterium]|nr:serine/threonine protein kinase [Gammaproteobacteria bacterium]
MTTQPDLQQFYIPEEQSVYLLSHDDARKLRGWVQLCEQQLLQLGYRKIEFIDKGAFGFVFGGVTPGGAEYVFKFSRINLPQHVQDRLEEEAFMLGQVHHPNVPRLIEFVRIKNQSILVMERASGINLEQLSLQQGRLTARLVLHIAAQIVAILGAMRNRNDGNSRPLIHGDIKPSNIMFDPVSENIALIDWGSSVFAQLDEQLHYVAGAGLIADDLQDSNARLGDVYFIGPEQLDGALSCPRFDEQGLAATLYALASGQSCRFGCRAIPPTALGLPLEFARVLEGMLDQDPKLRSQAGDYFLSNMSSMARVVVLDLPLPEESQLIPVWTYSQGLDIETVSYSSRKSFLKEEGAEGTLGDIDDVQFDHYYKNFLQGMGDTEKAFLASVGRLAKYPVLGGLAVRWEKDGVYIDSCLNLYDLRFKASFTASVNNMVNLARAIYRQGVFKSCLFNARDTLHLDRDSALVRFQPASDLLIPYEITDAPDVEDKSRIHSYFEDGKDPEESLELPRDILSALQRLNRIHHTGLLIFESLPTHLKIHNNYRLLDPAREDEFQHCLTQVVAAVPEISGLGISGYIKMPYKDTRFFTHIDRLPERYYPKNPRKWLQEN